MITQVNINIPADNTALAIQKKVALEQIAAASPETLTKIAELIRKPNAETKFMAALSNPIVKALF